MDCFEIPLMCPKPVFYNTFKSFSTRKGYPQNELFVYWFSQKRHHEMLRFIVFYGYWALCPLETVIKQTCIFLKIKILSPCTRSNIFHDSQLFFVILKNDSKLLQKCNLQFLIVFAVHWGPRLLRSCSYRSSQEAILLACVGRNHFFAFWQKQIVKLW